MSINPANSSNPQINPTASNSKLVEMNENEIGTKKKDDKEPGFDVNQEGSGIHLPGYKRPDNYIDSNEAKFPPNISPSANINFNQLSNETSDFARARDVLENRALGWLEQELLARFLNGLDFHRDTAEYNINFNYYDENDYGQNGNEDQNDLNQSHLRKFIKSYSCGTYFF